jgi:hypothetical protein
MSALLIKEEKKKKKGTWRVGIAIIGHSKLTSY